METGTHPDGAGSAVTARGFQRVWDPRVWGTLIGAIGATVFVMANRGSLDGPWPVVSVAFWCVAAASYAVAVFGVRRRFAEVPPLSARSGWIYLGSVAAMLALIRAGTVGLDAAERDALRPALIVLIVGLHFLPFAGAFHAPLFRWLGALMTILGLAGLALGWVWTETAAPAVAVATGVVMLAAIASDAFRTRQPLY